MVRNEVFLIHLIPQFVIRNKLSSIVSLINTFLSISLLLLCSTPIRIPYPAKVFTTPIFTFIPIIPISLIFIFISLIFTFTLGGRWSRNVCMGGILRFILPHLLPPSLLLYIMRTSLCFCQSPFYLWSRPGSSSTHIIPMPNKVASSNPRK